MADNIKIVGEILNTQQVARYNEEDVRLFIPQTLQENFGLQNDYIEYFVYDAGDNLLNTNYSYKNFKLPQTSFVESIGSLPIIEIDPIKDLQTLGYSSGEFKVQYNLFNNKLSSPKAELFLKEISADRTELRVGSTVLTNFEIETGSLALINEYTGSSYFVDYLVNFGNNVQVTAVNIALNKIESGYEVLFKLYQPLPDNIQEKVSLWVVKEKVNPYVFDINLDKLIIQAPGPQLRGPNFSIDIPNQNNIATSYQTYGGLVNSFSNVSSSYQQLLSLITSQSIDINTDYSNFTNFVNFSSAKQRVVNFYSKVKQIEDYNTNIAKYTISSSFYPNMINDNKTAKASINDIIANFDGFEYNLYFESGSTITSSYDYGIVPFPKSGSLKPYVLFSTSSISASIWFNAATASADKYDDYNQNNLIYTTPAFIKDDENNEQYMTFLNMIGHYFDNIWIFLQAITDVNLANNNLDQGISKDLVYPILQSLGTKLYNKYGDTDNISFLIGNSGSINFNNNFSKNNATASLTLSSASLSPFFIPSGSFSINGIQIAITASNPVANTPTKIYVPLIPTLTVWSTSGALITAKSNLAGAGTISSAVAFGGNSPTSNTTENFNGSSWSSGNAMINGMAAGAGTGLQTAALSIGSLFPQTACTEEYDGINWSAGGALITARGWIAAAGTQNAALAFGGAISPTLGTAVACTEVYNGTTWSSGNILITARVGLAGAGIQNDALSFGGNSNGPFLGTTEAYNGSTWSTKNNMINAKCGGGGAGASSTSALAFGGFAVSSIYYYTEIYNGSTWSTSTRLITGRTKFGSAGITSATTALAFGGEYSATNLSATEVYTTALIPTYADQLASASLAFNFSSSVSPYNASWQNITSTVSASTGLYFYTNQNINGDLGNTYYATSGSTTLYFTGGTGSFLNTIPRKDLLAESYKRIYHNLPLLLKQKGTISGLKTLISTFGITSSILNVKEYGGDSKYNMLDEYNSNKIRIVSSSIVTGSVLSPYVSLQTQTTTSSLFRTNDLHYVDISFSPETQIDTYASASIALTNPSWSLDNYIGDPRQLYSSSYSDLVSQQNTYYNFTSSNMDYAGFIRLIQYFDNSLFKMLKDYVPARANLSTGITISSPVLERNKWSYAKTAGTTKISSSDGTIDGPSISTEYTNIYTRLTGSRAAYYTGAFTGSLLNVYKYFVSGNFNPYLHPTASLTSNDINFFKHSNYNVLLNNVTQSRLSLTRRDIEYFYGTTSSITTPAYLQDTNESLVTYNRARYDGAKVSSLYYNTYTSASSTYDGDMSYGKTAAIDRNSIKLGLFTEISESKFLPRRNNARLKYLVDIDGNFTELNLRNKNWPEVQNIFVASDTGSISLFNNQLYGNQKTTDGEKIIFDSGYTYNPILYFAGTGSDKKLYFQTAGEVFARSAQAKNTLTPYYISGSGLSLGADEYPLSGGFVPNIFDTLSNTEASTYFSPGKIKYFPSYSAVDTGDYSVNVSLPFTIDPKTSDSTWILQVWISGSTRQTKVSEDSQYFAGSTPPPTYYLAEIGYICTASGGCATSTILRVYLDSSDYATYVGNGSSWSVGLGLIARTSTGTPISNYFFSPNQVVCYKLTAGTFSVNPNQC
jgi:hypothetical protein